MESGPIVRFPLDLALVKDAKLLVSDPPSTREPVPRLVVESAPPPLIKSLPALVRPALVKLLFR